MTQIALIRFPQHAITALDTHSFMKGFTLIELVVTTGVILLIAGGVVANYNNYSDNQRLKQAALTLKNNLRLVQTKAASAEKPASGCSEMVGYQVSFTSTSYSIQARCVEGLAGSSTSTNLPAGITFSPVPAAVVFRVLTRGVASDTPLDIYLDGRIKLYRLQIEPGGDIVDLGFQ